MRTLKLMADYQCHPLWEASPGTVDNIDPEKLPISTALKERLNNWAHDFDSTLDLDDPAMSGFKSEEQEAVFKNEGQVLGSQLQHELGNAFTVIIKI